MPTQPSDFLYRLWDQGQQHLAAGRYAAARRELEAAEATAWRHADARSLARLYLPLLEARRLIRYQAVEGVILICPPPPALSTTHEHHLLRQFLNNESGTILLSSSAPHKTHSSPDPTAHIRHLAGSVQYEARRSGHWLEALLLIQHGTETRIASAADPTFAAGISICWTQCPTAPLGDSTDPDLIIPLPPPAQYTGKPATVKTEPSRPSGLHALARESLLVTWEALALKWQRRHPPPRSSPTARNAKAQHPAWNEMAWLRLALRIDPACEPISMRLMALAEAIERA